MALPTDAAERKDVPIASGVLDYFPDALIAVARLSQKGNEQHNPGQPLHWDRDKSTDEADALMRHFLDRGTLDKDGIPHSAKVAWRALALLQKEEEDAKGLPLPRGARSAQTAREAFVEAVYEEETEDDNAGPGAEDGPWAEGYAERAGGEDGPFVPVFAPGERVRVAHGGSYLDDSPGFNNNWVSSMDYAIRSTFKVESQNEFGVQLDGLDYDFPPLALERVDG